MAKIVKPRPEEPHPDPRHWDAVRQKALKRDGYKCRLCGDDDELHVHHLTYENWGHEKKKDLTTLCKEHHKLFHRQNKKLKKKTPKCPKCDDIHDVVGPNSDGNYRCNYHTCGHYFNELGEITESCKEDETKYFLGDIDIRNISCPNCSSDIVCQTYDENDQFVTEYEYNNVPVEIFENSIRCIEAGCKFEIKNNTILVTGHYEDGSICSERTYLNVHLDEESLILDGKSTWFFSSGKISSEQYFEKGKRVGFKREWDEDGRIIKETQYEDGKRKLFKMWDSSGQLREETNYKNGLVDGLSREWDENGSLILSEEWENHKPVSRNGKPIETVKNFNFPKLQKRRKYNPDDYERDYNGRLILKKAVIDELKTKIKRESLDSELNENYISKEERKKQFKANLERLPPKVPKKYQREDTRKGR